MPGVRFPVSELFTFFGTQNYFFDEGGLPETRRVSYGHTTVKAPYPIRTAKLSTVGPDQYYGRGLRGNLRCCKSIFLFFCLSGAVRQKGPDRAPIGFKGYWRNRKRACLASTRYWDRNPDTPIRYGVVGNISACHADARGSIPRFGVLFFYFIFFWRDI